MLLPTVLLNMARLPALTCRCVAERKTTGSWRVFDQRRSQNTCIKVHHNLHPRRHRFDLRPITERDPPSCCTHVLAQVSRWCPKCAASAQLACGPPRSHHDHTHLLRTSILRRLFGAAHHRCVCPVAPDNMVTER